MHWSWPTAICAALALPLGNVALAGDADFVGQWELDGPVWKGRLVITARHISVGPGECSNLPYNIIRQSRTNERESAYAIDVAAPGKCRAAGQEKVIYHFNVLRADPQDFIGVQVCPSLEDLELLLQGKNRYCAGVFGGMRSKPKR